MKTKAFLNWSTSANDIAIGKYFYLAIDRVLTYKFTWVGI